MDIRHSILPPTVTVAPRQLLRRTFHPYGKEGASFSIVLRDGPAGSSYQLTAREPGVKKPRTVFDGPAVLSADLDETAASILDVLTRAPGDDESHDFSQYTPPQLDWAVQHAHALRQLVGARLAWQDSKVDLRSDLEATYSRRALGELRHRFRFGIVDVAARTKRDAKAGCSDAIRNQCSATPIFGKNGMGELYALFPRGAEWVIQVLQPGSQDWLGDVHTFAARTPEEAEAELSRLVNERQSRRPATRGSLRANPLGVRA